MQLNDCSVTQDTFLGQQRLEPTAADRLHSTTVGPKENTGFMQNSRHMWTADCPARFITDYQIRSELCDFLLILKQLLISSVLIGFCCKLLSLVASCCRTLCLCL